MQEYTTVTVKAKQGFAGAKGTIDTEALDEVLNDRAQAGWSLSCIESLEHTAGTHTLLCVFEREAHPA